jgi:hypothetical protein
MLIKLRSTVPFILAASFALLNAQTDNGLQPVIQETGFISVSVDGLGMLGDTGIIKVNKPEGASVRKAYLMASSHGINGPSTINDGEVELLNTPVTWELAQFNSAGFDSDFFHNVFAEVTQIVRDEINSADPGMVDIQIRELDSNKINGTILVVVFDDPGQNESRGLVLFFGSQRTDGDSFTINLAQPYQSGDQMIMGLGISHGFQSTTGTDMVNLIDINNIRMTSSAGGEDDGESINGALITVGGISDSVDLPDPFAGSSGFDTDDELYDFSSFLLPGDTQIELFSINPTDDDDIFFAYLLTSAPAAVIPDVAPPGDTSLFGKLNPDIPTIVLTHGLQDDDTDIADIFTGFGPLQAGGLIRGSLDETQANVVQYIWNEAFQPYSGLGSFPVGSDYIKAQQNVPTAGLRLAHLLLSALGTDYENDIHLIGHSLGTGVNAYAANALIQQGTGSPRIQVTALDRPDNVSKIPLLSPAEEALYGFDVDFFARTIDMSYSNLWIDNYFALDGDSGVGDIASGIRVYNHLPDTGLVEANELDTLFNESFFENNHTGVHQWYRWSMSPNNPVNSDNSVCSDSVFTDPPNSDIGQTLSPCQNGWHWSITQNFGQFPDFNADPPSETLDTPLATTSAFDFGCDVEVVNGNLVRVSCPGASRFTPVRFGSNQDTNNFAAADIIIPEESSLAFDYIVTQPGDGDYLAVVLNNNPIWVLRGDDVESGQTYNSGMISLGNFQGTHRLSIASFDNGTGEEAFFEFSNLRIETSGFNSFVRNWPEPIDVLGLVRKINE